MENTLKRCLKRKVKVTLGMVIAFMITGVVSFGEIISDKGNATTKDIVSSDDYILDVTGKDEGITGILAQNNHKVELTGKNIEIDVINITEIPSTENEYYLTKYEANGVLASNPKISNSDGGKIKLGDKETENIKVNVKTQGWAQGLGALRGDIGTGNANVLEINGKNLNVNVHSDKYYAYGILAQNTTTPATNKGNESTVIINAENTVINATSGIKIDPDDGDNHAIGLVVFSQGRLIVNGNLEVNADTVLATRGDAIAKINENGKNTVKLNGDINFNYNKETSGTPINADVTINLSNPESYLNGNILITGTNNKPVPPGYDEINSMKLGLSNGAQWTTTSGENIVNKLTLDNGVINVRTKSQGDHSIKIDELSGTGGTIAFESEMSSNGTVKVADGNIKVKEVKDNTKINIGFSGIDADNLLSSNVKLEEQFNNLKDKVLINTGNDKVEKSYFAEEGLVNGKITATIDENGKVNISEINPSTTVSGLQALSTNTYIAWKQEMNSLNKRMGELRDSTGEHGVWARVYAGKSEYNKGYENEYQTYQVGYDKKYLINNGTAFLGYLVSYTQGDSDYNHNSYGTGENKSIGAGVYGTWLGNSGDYVDIIFKVSNLENDYDITSLSGIKSKGDYDTLGFSLSTEYGKRLKLDDKLFLEPSAQLSLGRVNSVNYKTSSRLEVKQDTIYSVEGKIGTALGYSFNKGNVYVRAAGVKEFAGEIDTTIAGKNFEEDLGDSWLEFGVGMNYRLQENLNLYVDFEKTGSAEVETDWQANLGFRYEF